MSKCYNCNSTVNLHTMGKYTICVKCIKKGINSYKEIPNKGYKKEETINLLEKLFFQVRHDLTNQYMSQELADVMLDVEEHITRHSLFFDT